MIDDKAATEGSAADCGNIRIKRQGRLVRAYTGVGTEQLALRHIDLDRRRVAVCPTKDVGKFE